ncbi:CST complex subunit STN1 [Fasciola gigantica]|uniref:CST complex subunit STN1 n=1 Tax=Fasciola gigantica TaxID=46835 RepID=A0A504Y9B9_FASGI|nr:CST complex subunit STN1 [Fasciola gigantica]
MSLSLLDDSQWFSAATIALGKTFEEHAASSVVLDPLANEHYHLLISDLLKIHPAGDLNLFRFGPRWVLYVDIVGIIRTLFEREKFYLIELDDGTGCVTCTVWRQSDEYQSNQHRELSKNTADFEYTRVCEHLLSLACTGHSAWIREERLSLLQVGLSIRLRGRVKRFRGKINVNAFSYRVLSDAREELLEIIHRDRLRREIYQKPYDPGEIRDQVLKSLASNSAQLTITDACRILEEDSLYTFTKLDLCLNSRLADRLTANSNPVIFDPSDAAPDWLSDNSDGIRDVKNLVDELLKHLLAEGWIYPSSEPIGGRTAYHFLNGDNRVAGSSDSY